MTNIIPTKVRTALAPLFTCSRSCACGLPFDRSRALIPRIFFGNTARPDRLVAIVVGKNPGRPNEAEAAFYAKGTEKGLPLIDLQAKWGEYCPVERPFGRDSNYHRTLMRFLRRKFGLTDHGVIERVYFTEAVKCSTPGGEEQKVVDGDHIARCVENHVSIYALGREVERALRSRFPQREITYLSHPSYGWRSSTPRCERCL